MSTDLSDLLSGEPPKRGRGRPTKEDALAKLESSLLPLPHYSKFRQPVGVTFLADVVGKQPKQIAKRLVKCPVASWVKHQGKDQPMYDFLTAMSYLIAPKGNIEDWFSQQNAASLPPYVNKMFWDAAHQRNRVMLASNDLWHTEDVLLVLGRVAMTVRQEAKLWIEDLPEKDQLSELQYNALIDATNRLVDTIRQTLVEMPRSTLSMTAHIKSELESSGKMIADEDRAVDDDDDE